MTDDRDLSVRIASALVVAYQFSQFDGDHHKAWAIDQMVRLLTGDGYADWVKRYRDGEDGPESYTWHEGIAP